MKSRKRYRINRIELLLDQGLAKAMEKTKDDELLSYEEIA